MLHVSRPGWTASLLTLCLHAAAQQAPLPEAVPAPSVPAAIVAVDQAAAPARSTGGTMQRGDGILGVALSEARLEHLRGGSATPWSDMKLNGAVSGNSAMAVTTGANVITEGAFSNASGLPMVIQNSGANVLIQNATIVNVQFK